MSLLILAVGEDCLFHVAKTSSYRMMQGVYLARIKYTCGALQWGKIAQVGKVEAPPSPHALVLSQTRPLRHVYVWLCTDQGSGQT